MESSIEMKETNEGMAELTVDINDAGEKVAMDQEQTDDILESMSTEPLTKEQAQSISRTMFQACLNQVFKCDEDVDIKKFLQINPPENVFSAMEEFVELLPTEFNPNDTCEDIVFNRHDVVDTASGLGMKFVLVVRQCPHGNDAMPEGRSTRRYMRDEKKGFEVAGMHFRKGAYLARFYVEDTRTADEVQAVRDEMEKEEQQQHTPMESVQEETDAEVAEANGPVEEEVPVVKPAYVFTGSQEEQSFEAKVKQATMELREKWQQEALDKNRAMFYANVDEMAEAMHKNDPKRWPRDSKLEDCERMLEKDPVLVDAMMGVFTNKLEEIHSREAVKLLDGDTASEHVSAFTKVVATAALDQLREEEKMDRTVNKVLDNTVQKMLQNRSHEKGTGCISEEFAQSFLELLRSPINGENSAEDTANSVFDLVFGLSTETERHDIAALVEEEFPVAEYGYGIVDVTGPAIRSDTLFYSIFLSQKEQAIENLAEALEKKQELTLKSDMERDAFAKALELEFPDSYYGDGVKHVAIAIRDGSLFTTINATSRQDAIQSLATAIKDKTKRETMLASLTEEERAALLVKEELEFEKDKERSSTPSRFE